MEECSLAEKHQKRHRDDIMERERWEVFIDWSARLGGIGFES